MALSQLIDAQATCGVLERRIPLASRRTVHQMIEKKLNSPLTSSCGRLFDAVAALAGVRDVASYEGQAAMQLEWLAQGTVAQGVYPFQITDLQVGGDESLVVDTRPMIKAIAGEADGGISPGAIARRFHETLVQVIVRVCGLIRNSTGISEIVLSGGVFMNTLLTEKTTSRLREEGCNVYRQEKVPPNDGGLSLGQLAVAASMNF
jgi:hydrogenase maturation protein HypF